MSFLQLLDRARVMRVCNGVLYFLLLTLLFCGVGDKAAAAVTVTPASNGTSICSNKAIGGTAPAFTTLSTITITEGANADITGSSGGVTNTIVLNAPTGWQFNSSALPSFSFITGSNITSVTGSITSSTLTVYITANNTNNADQVFINGLQVQATSTSSVGGNVYASSVTGVAGITTGSGGTNFATLLATAPATPSLTITASPSGAVCPGTPVNFVATVAYGGTSPSFQWQVNGSNVAAGSSYATSTLSSGNSVSCILTSSLACVTSTTATSNIITMTLNPAPAAITGAATTCQGSASTLSSSTAGGTWSSTTTGVATVSGGVVSGVAPGTTTISYTVAGCASTITFYVNLPPLAPSLSPTSATICNATALPITALGTPAPMAVLVQNFNSGIAPWTVDNTGSSGALSGSEWKSCGDGYVNEQGLYHSPDNSAFAMSNSDTSGSLSYTSSQLISPVFSLAGYSSATLSFQHAYEAWTGDINVKVDISTDGGATWGTLRNYLGTSAGTRISFATDVFSLNSYLGQTNLKLRFYYYCHWGYYWAVDNVSVTGTSSLVVPTWSPTTYLFLDSLGTIPYTGGATATVYVKPAVGSSTTLNYTATSSIGACTATAGSAITVNPTPGVIMGNVNICIGSVSSLTDAAGGGTWVSSNTAVATIGSATGVVQGVATGTATISYIAGTGCAATVVVTVNTTPAAIGGIAAVCLGSSTTLTDATTGGTWMSTDPSVATIGSSNGVVSPIAIGTTTITYSLGAGCTTTQVVTVNTVPSAITGASSVCMGQDITLSDATSGGTWASNNTSTASAGTSSGIITGVASGTATITYIMPGVGCYVVKPVTVNLLGAIVGPTNVCAGQSVTLGDIYSGGTWSSGTPSVASISTGGVVTGGTPGTSIISYTMPTGCTATYPFTVNPLPNVITGPTNICLGLTMTLSSTTPGGSWSSSNTSVATVGSGNGGVYGVAIGSAVISYMLPTGCFITTTVTVNPLPSPISGPTTVCSAGSATLSDATTGGTWSSSNTTMATVSASGTVTGGNAGPVVISYTLPTGCYVTQAMTINPLPANITGPSSVCVGASITLSDATTGGTWSSSNIAVANVGSASGLVTGYVAGNTTITYALPTGCIISTVVSVNPLPGAITGTATVCVAQTTSLSSATPGGTWSGGSPYASVTSSTGVVSGSVAGNAYITYTLSTGCYVTRQVTVNPLPASITGTLNICVGATSSLSDATVGGTWTSSTSSVGTIGPSSGLLNGIAAGTTLVSYILPTGCVASATATVNALPSAITGPGSVCVASTITLADASIGGTWSCSGTTVASINTTTGVLTGLGTGTTTVTYSVASGCIATTVVTVNGLPGAITGPNTVCQNANIVLSTTSSGGTWSSSSISTATVSTGTGIVTGGGTAGTVTITYTLASGCYATKLVTVNISPSAITGIGSICSGSSTSLSSATTGGTWTSGSTAIATVGSTTGIVNGISSGSTLIYYTLGNGCAANKLVTVYPLPGAITGSTIGCTGSATTLSSATTGGTWTSSNTAVANIGSADGVMTGVVVGTARITYTLSSGCFVSTTVTINTSPSSVSGPSAVCLGSAAIYSDATTGGSWSSSDASVASIGSSSGFLTGYGAGTVNISYTLSSGCYALLPVTINTLPAAISGVSSICQGLTISFSDATTGGVWTSSNTTVATVGSTTGLVTANAPGTAVIYYTLPSGCAASKFVTVNAAPTAITGSTSICQASTSTLANTVSGGTWSSTNTSVASIGSNTGVVAGLSVGTSIISYSTGTGCFAVTTVTVNISPAGIIGLASVCQGNTMTLSCTTTGGVWSSSNTAIATVGTGGAVTGVSPGTATISYGISAGCSVTRTVTVNAIPAPISGVSTLCTGGSLALSDGTSGGTWSSNNTAVATIGSSTGILIAGTTGTVTISYILSNGCANTTTFTVGSPTPITGTNVLCVGTITSLSNVTPGGSWTSNAVAIATIGSVTGVTLGISAGTATITYAIGTGCRSSMMVTVYPAPAAITGGGAICAGAALTLDDASTGGTWSSGDNAIATVGSGSGIVSGVAGGTVDISYTTATGCVITKNVTVNAPPPAIAGTGDVCLGLPITLTDAITGGTWSSSDASVASVGSSSGVVMGSALSTAIITYTLPTGCYVIQIVTVNGLPASIFGPGSVCQALTIALSDVTAGGSWGSSNTSIASIGSSSGVVSGVSGGTAVVSYSLPSGCFVSTVVTVNSVAPISGPNVLCTGNSATLSDATGAGTWTSSNTAVATVGVNSGVVSAIAAGTTTITYSYVSGCSTTMIVSVNPSPAAITGPSSACVGSAITLGDATTGGTWSCSGAGSIGSASGILTGISTGTASVTYSLSAGCAVTTTVNVHPVPAPITGTNNFCLGYVSTLSDVTPGGTWVSQNVAIATIGSSSGILTATTTGDVLISYVMPTGCFAGVFVDVLALTPISGANSICVGDTTTLTNAFPYPTWTSSNPSVATISSSSGMVTGVAAGTTTITRIFGVGCDATKTVTVMPLPVAITGPATVCQSLTASLADATGGGTWSSSGTSVATIGSTSGIVSGVAAGVATVSYVLSTGCFTTSQITVNPVPAAISGLAAVCSGLATTMSDATTGGTWSSSNATIASVGSSSGVVTGAGTGTATISYVLPTGCFVTRVITINSLPAAITGPSAVCVGFSVTLGSGSPGGTWSSSNTAVATIGSTNGVISGLAVGSSVITYSLGTGCIITQPVNVTPLPSAITGSTPVCVGSAITLADVSAGGSWSASTAILTVGSATGVVTGVNAGTAVVTYSVGSGCITTTVVTVNPLPSAISGSSSVCIGSSSTLSSTPAGTWSSSATGTASINSGGVLSGIAAGTALITYTLPTGCFNTIAVSVNPLPMAIAGADAVCIGSAITLSDGMSGGAWSGTSSNISVSATSGIITGVTAGTAVVTYVLPTGCVTTKTLTVNPLPAAISGTAVVCQGNSATLTDVTPGGTWASGSPIATVGSSSGIVTGITAGTVSISYVLSTGCYATKIFTVNPQLPITGSAIMCLGSLAPLNNDAPGGVWTSSNTSIATIGSATGLAMGVSLGTTVISYSLPTGCASSLIVTVYPIPTAITGTMTLCQGSTTALSNATPGGSWSSSPSSIATVGASDGIVSGVGAGTANVFYVLSTGCAASAVVTVNPLQPISGPATLCMGNAAAYLNSVPGGAWSSSTTGVATVDASSGVVTAHTAGTTLISYMLSTGCLATTNVTVNALPSVHNVTGGGVYCAGGAGVPVGLNNSSVGVTYKLYKDTTYMGGLVGTGSALNFGLQTAAGTYSVIAISSTTGCYRLMGDTAVVSISSVVTPSVTIASFIHDSACFSMPTVFYAYASGGGSAPTYSWRVNGVGTGGTSSNYTFVPAGGDILSCTMVSNAACRTADSASASITVTILPLVVPTVSLSLTPNDTVCDFTPVVLTPIAAGGGYTPSFTWIKNGVSVGTFPSYTYTPADGDAVHCVMTSNAICRTSDTASSGVAHFTVLPYVVPTITINATPSLDITAGESVTFDATISNGGTAPIYQWYINTVAVPGATSSTFISSSLSDHDSVSCTVTSSGVCASQAVGYAIVRVYALGISATGASSDMVLLPNPNNGTFTVRGAVMTDADRVQLSVTDVLGRVVYLTHVPVANERVNASITLPSWLANGIYQLHIADGTQSALIRFTISR